MLVHISSLYAALLAFVWLVLFGSIGRLRTNLNVPLGDGGHPALILAIRRYANFVECVPLALLLLVLADLNGATPMWLHALGIILVVSRIAHPFGLAIETMQKAARMIGAGGTLFVTLASAVTLLWQYLRG